MQFQSRFDFDGTLDANGELFVSKQIDTLAPGVYQMSIFLSLVQATLDVSASASVVVSAAFGGVVVGSPPSLAPGGTMSMNGESFGVVVPVTEPLKFELQVSPEIGPGDPGKTFSATIVAKICAERIG